jgi:hypothetical protein
MQAKEKAIGVLVALAQRIGQAYIARHEPRRVVSWFATLLKRRIPKRRPEDLIGAIIDSLVYLEVYLNEASASQLLRSLEGFPQRNAKQLQMMARSASYYLVHKIESNDSEARLVRFRAGALELRILTAVDLGLQAFERNSNSTRPGSFAKESESVRELLGAVENLVFQLAMFINANPRIDRSDGKLNDDASVGMFFQETAELWNAVVSLDSSYRRPMSPASAHYLMEAFNRLLPINAERVLKLAWSVITGSTLGYPFDQMAIQEFVKFAEAILADHRDLLREEQHAVRFAEILDVFVEAGWPEATRIIIQMDSAVR